MRITPDIVRDELIGTEAEVSRSSDPGCVGIFGRVVDETRNTFRLLHEGRIKTVVKEQSVFHFTLSGGTVVEIRGKLLVGRPEDRLKRPIKRLW